MSDLGRQRRICLPGRGIKNNNEGDVCEVLYAARHMELKDWLVEAGFKDAAEQKRLLV